MMAGNKERQDGGSVELHFDRSERRALGYGIAASIAIGLLALISALFSRAVFDHVLPHEALA